MITGVRRAASSITYLVRITVSQPKISVRLFFKIYNCLFPILPSQEDCDFSSGLFTHIFKQHKRKVGLKYLKCCMHNTVVRIALLDACETWPVLPADVEGLILLEHLASSVASANKQFRSSKVHRRKSVPRAQFMPYYSAGFYWLG